MSNADYLFLAGSSRKNSINKQLARQASDMGAELGGSCQFIDLIDYEMPLYNGDLEDKHGLPANAIRFKEALAQCKGVFIACPEYNSSITPLLKNSLDWASRPHLENEKTYAAYRGKTAAISSASPGGFGGVRALLHLRTILATLGVIVLPTQTTVSKAYEMMDDGRFTNDYTLKSLGNTVRALITS